LQNSVFVYFPIEVALKQYEITNITASSGSIPMSLINNKSPSYNISSVSFSLYFLNASSTPLVTVGFFSTYGFGFVQ